MTERIVLDTSVIISGIMTDLIKKEEIKDAEIIIPEFVVEELRAQASKGREIGFKGLEEIKKLISLFNKANLQLKYAVLPQLPLELAIIEWSVKEGDTE